jgi:hypothetical protein
VCQKRLARLRALGLVESFRRRDPAGLRQPARWVLGPEAVGMTATGVTEDRVTVEDIAERAGVTVTAVR